MNIREIIVINGTNQNITIQYDEIFPPNSKFQSRKFLKNRLHDYLVHAQPDNIIATDVSVNDERAALGIVSQSLGWSFAVRLPNFTPVFEADLMAIIMALRKLPSEEHSALILTDAQL